MTSPYTDQQKADAIAQALAGTPYSEISQCTGIPAGTIKSWVSRSTTAVATVATTPGMQARTHAEQLREDMAALLHAKMLAATRQAEYYGSEEWIKGRSAEALLESYRALTRGLVLLVDRLGGGSATQYAGAADERD